MKMKLKIILYVSGGIVFALVVLLSILFLLNNPYRKQLPSLPEMQSLSAPLKEQISAAHKKAYRNPSSGNIGWLGMVYHSSANYDKAAVCYKLAIERDKTKWIWSYYLAYLNQEMGDPNAALEEYRQVLKINPQIYQAWFYSGECYQKLGATEKAEMSYNNVLRLMKKNAIIKTAERYDYFPLVTYSMYQLSRIYFDTKQLDLAEKTLKEIIESQ